MAAGGAIPAVPDPLPVPSCRQLFPRSIHSHRTSRNAKRIVKPLAMPRKSRERRVRESLSARPLPRSPPLFPSLRFPSPGSKPGRPPCVRYVEGPLHTPFPTASFPISRLIHLSTARVNREQLQRQRQPSGTGVGHCVALEWLLLDHSQDWISPSETEYSKFLAHALQSLEVLTRVRENSEHFF